MTKISIAASSVPVGSASKPAAAPMNPVCNDTTPPIWPTVIPVARSIANSRARSSCRANKALSTPTTATRIASSRSTWVIVNVRSKIAMVSA